MLRSIKNLGKMLIRQSVDCRLNRLPLSEATAGWYADRIRKYPAILGDLNGRRNVELPAGIMMNVGIVDVIERSLLTTGTWDRIVQDCLQQLLKPGDTFLDVGANIGYFSMLASKIVGESGTVVSFEPSARALTRLTLHGCMNRCRNLLVCSHAVGEVAGRAALNWASAANIGGSTINRGTGAHVEQIFVRRLDDVCEELSLKPRLIKMDIEGFEMYALEGARQMLQQYHPNVICELTGAFLKDHGQSSESLVRFMAELNYRAFLMSLSSEGQLLLKRCLPEETPSDQAEVLFSLSDDPLARHS